MVRWIFSNWLLPKTNNKKKPFEIIVNLLGGRIDHAHHYNNPYRALEETLVLESTLKAIMAKVDLSETLIVVTADHSHVMTMGGLATPRGNPILGMYFRYLLPYFVTYLKVGNKLLNVCDTFGPKQFNSINEFIFNLAEN